jgi:hypothetical protein
MNLADLCGRHPRESLPVTLTRLLDYLPHGNLLDDAAWRKWHQLLLWVLGLHVPALFVFALWLRHSPQLIAFGLIPVVACIAIGAWIPHRRLASFFTSAGLVYCSAALVVFSRGSIEAHFLFFLHHRLYRVVSGLGAVLVEYNFYGA